MEANGDGTGGGNRARLLIVAGLVVVLALAVTGVLLLSGEEEHQFDPAPTVCVDDWNQDAAALVLGQHQFAAHRYQKLEVLHLTPDRAAAPTSANDKAGTCAIVFAAAILDSEESSTAQILRPIGWLPLSGAGTPRERLAELQEDAQERFNALLQPDGSIEPL